MRKIDSTAGASVLQGSTRIFLAESLMLPTGLLTVVFLTRTLGPESYGLYSLAAVITSWTGWTIASIFNRTTVKFVSETQQWKPVASTALRLYGLTGLAALAALILLAWPISRLLAEPSLIKYLCLFAVDIPLFALSSAHKAVLLGLGRFAAKALVSSVYWIARLALIILFVEMGLSLTGAILASICASLLELGLVRCFVRPPVFGREHFPLAKFWQYSAPLFLAALSVRIFDRLDLFALKSLGGTAAQAGVYAAAQNLTLIPGILALAFADPLLAALTRLYTGGRLADAKLMARNAMRLVLLLFPFAGIVAGASREIVGLFFGSDYLSAAPLVAILTFAALWMVMIAVTAGILTAGGKPNWTLVVTAPMVPLALCGHVLLIPRMGPAGAALITLTFATLHGGLAVYAVNRQWSVLPPGKSAVRSLLTLSVSYPVSAFWPVSEIWLLPKIAVLAIIVVILLTAAGEFSREEIQMVRGTFRRGAPEL